MKCSKRLTDGDFTQTRPLVSSNCESQQGRPDLYSLCQGPKYKVALLTDCFPSQLLEKNHNLKLFQIKDWKELFLKIFFSDELIKNDCVVINVYDE